MQSILFRIFWYLLKKIYQYINTNKVCVASSICIIKCTFGNYVFFSEMKNRVRIRRIFQLDAHTSSSESRTRVKYGANLASTSHECSRDPTSIITEASFPWVDRILIVFRGQIDKTLNMASSSRWFKILLKAITESECECISSLFPNRNYWRFKQKHFPLYGAIPKVSTSNRTSKREKQANSSILPNYVPIINRA